jgi:aspartate 1-decarboxylase
MGRQRTLLKSKIHRARVTDANLNYEGSLTIDADLMEQADILPYEKVDIANISNGHRFSTYAIEGQRGSGEIALNGAAARLGEVGDLLIILTYITLSEKEISEHTPIMLYVDETNQVSSLI